MRLALRRAPAAGARRAVALVGHAMMANAGYLARFAAALAARGVETWTLDFRGHGASPAPGQPWRFEDYVRRDLPAAALAVARAAGLAPEELAYVGHSLGGLVGAAAFGAGAAPAPRRLVLVATNVWLDVRGRRRAAVELLAAAARLFGRVPARRLGLGTEDEPRAYVEELTAWARAPRWPWTDGMAAIRCPALVVSGEADWMCTPHDARAFAAALGGPVRHRVVGRLRGDAFDPDHVRLLTDERLRPVWDEIAAFVL